MFTIIAMTTYLNQRHCKPSHWLDFISPLQQSIDIKFLLLLDIDDINCRIEWQHFVMNLVEVIAQHIFGRL